MSIVVVSVGPVPITVEQVVVTVSAEISIHFVEGLVEFVVFYLI